MRRKDREITDINEICKILSKCESLTLALFDEPYPYAVPLNFGYELVKNELRLYFHGANAGKKLKLIKQNPKAAFSADTSKEVSLSEKACNSTMYYESVTGSGDIKILENDKIHALSVIMEHYGIKNSTFDERSVAKVCVMELTVKHITGKKHEK